ncbi:hypothetical protein I4484_06980 [Halomonas sp. SS10-MC5]|uniref:hypothetical protein n=1 Tax=Halomonas sp. SS10-MC5 TaxID=2854257 RepID=UPI0018D23C94|nr:hypothetical protein [Halomonas sp. SS10-MC5]QPP50832.1 hypothetical protein I4484_06980 [Halomonas sp. SS10-MC5]
MSETLVEKPRVRVPAYRVEEPAAAAPARVEAFSFGDPVPVIDGYDFFYTGCWMMGPSGTSLRWTSLHWRRPIAPRRIMDRRSR